VAREDAVDLKTLQSEADALIRRFDDGYWPPLANLARLAEEVGELARALSQESGFKRRKAGEAAPDLALEMGDVLFTLAVLANQSGVDLGESAQAVLAKYRMRDLGDRA
jgi:NTP pyrophosphatase (non-canonical NTP hydrolase)